MKQSIMLCVVALTLLFSATLFAFEINNQSTTNFGDVKISYGSNGGMHNIGALQSNDAKTIDLKNPDHFVVTLWWLGQGQLSIIKTERSEKIRCSGNMGVYRCAIQHDAKDPNNAVVTISNWN